MHRIDGLLEEYGKRHQNPANKAVHWFCGPLIFWCVAALLWSLPTPDFMVRLPGLNWMTLAFIVVMAYYFTLSKALAVGFFFIGLFCVFLINVALIAGFNLWKTAAVLFVLAWACQFLGHKIEGAKPAFFRDIQFLLIGPAWLMGAIYRRIGLRS